MEITVLHLEISRYQLSI